MAIPVAEAYGDAIGELELNVLTDADISHTMSLYVLTSEIVQFKSNLSPIVNLVNAIRDHRSEPVGTPMLNGMPPKHFTSSVTISPMAQMYFKDVEDHCVQITDGLDQMRRAADNMIDLIFNKNGVLFEAFIFRKQVLRYDRSPSERDYEAAHGCYHTLSPSDVFDRERYLLPLVTHADFSRDISA